MKNLILVFIFLITLSSCVSNSKYQKLKDDFNNFKKDSVKVKEDKSLNKNYDEITTVLPREFELHRTDPKLLIGEILIFYTENVKSIGNYIKKESIKLIEEKDLSSNSVLYSSRVTGNFSSSVSFLINNVQASGDIMYDVSLQPMKSALIRADWSNFNIHEIEKDLIRPTFKSIVLVTGVEYRLLTYKEYKKYKTTGTIGISAVSFGGDAYYGDEKISAIPLLIIYYTDISGKCGDYVDAEKIYKKKENIEINTRLKSRFRSASPRRVKEIQMLLNKPKYKFIKK